MNHFTLIKKGLAYHESFAYEKALPHFERAWKKHPMCATSIYNYANTLHMLGRNDDAKRHLEVLLGTDDGRLVEGCPDSCETPRSLKLDAHFLLYHITLALTESFAEAFPHAVRHLESRARGVRSVWSRESVIRQLKADDPDPNAEQAEHKQEWQSIRAMTTPTSRPVSFISRNYNPHPVIDARLRW